MILTTNAIAPDGRRLSRGQTLPDDIGKQFVRDLRSFLVADDAHPLLRLEVTSEEQFLAAWRRIHEHDVEADPLVIVAADRIRHAATAAGLHRLAALRPFVDQLSEPDDETPQPPTPTSEVGLKGTSSRGRRTS